MHERDAAAIEARDAAPEAFFEAGFDAAAAGYPGKRAVGYKFMIGHNPRLLREVIARREDIALIHVHRENKLAQAASLLQAEATSQWALVGEPGAPQPMLPHRPLQLTGVINDNATRDFLFAEWLSQLPHRRLSVEYREMFLPGFEERLCDFLGVAYDPTMSSNLRKQGTNRVLDRFEHRKAIATFMRRIGHGDWLGEEL